MNPVLTSLRSFILFTLILGGLYPLLITFISGVLFPVKSQGSLLKSGNQIIGSGLIGQKFTHQNYFWGRPSAADYDPLKSSGTQLSGTSETLKKNVLNRKNELGELSPSDMLYASASGLDPHISPQSASFQKKRIMKNRGLSEVEVEKLILLATEERFLGFMGQPRVNVLELNRLLDKK